LAKFVKFETSRWKTKPIEIRKGQEERKQERKKKENDSFPGPSDDFVAPGNKLASSPLVFVATGL
jgi:hypothetical protein